MALITITGFPCSGKTHVAQSIQANFKARLAASSYSGPSYQVIVVSDSSVPYTFVVSASNPEPDRAKSTASPTWRNSYDSSLEEKPARASLFSNVTRELGTDRIVLCDAANYIKGFRYQMYCAGREAKCRVATVFAAASPDQCASRHDVRDPSERYRAETFDNMIQRYEEPSSMVRWDSPLFTFSSSSGPPSVGNRDSGHSPAPDPELATEENLDVASGLDSTQLEGAEWDKIVDELWLAVTTGDLKGPTAAVAEAPKPPANSIQVLTTGTSHAIALLLTTLSFQASPPSSLTLPASSPFTAPMDIRLPSDRIPNRSELQRLKRQFETIQKRALGTNAGRSDGSKVWTEQAVGEAFVGFLQASWGT